MTKAGASSLLRTPTVTSSRIGCLVQKLCNQIVRKLIEIRWNHIEKMFCNGNDFAKMLYDGAVRMRQLFMGIVTFSVVFVGVCVLDESMRYLNLEEMQGYCKL